MGPLFAQTLRQHPAALAALVYVAATAVVGRDVIAGLTTHLANDVGDPGLNAAILAWSATHVPGTDAWFQFPIFYPVADALTLSEHLLGVSVIATPLYWLTGSAIAAYNLALLITYPLSGLAMYALIHRLTGSAGAAFLAGLAYAFAPYRVAQVAHIQMLTVFWAPLALLGLHGFLEGWRGQGARGRAGWLAFFAICWACQGAANGYMLVYFSGLVGLWVLWFVVAPGRWRDLAPIAGAAALAILPFAPILLRFVEAHAFNGFTRAPEEVAFYAGEVQSIACPHPSSAMWGWLTIGCRQAASGEQYQFPGAAILVLCAAGTWFARPTHRRVGLGRALTILSRVLLAAALVFAAAALSVAVNGPWLTDVGPIRISSSSVLRPFTVAMGLLLASFLTSSWFRTLPRTPSVAGFYVVAAIVALVLSWGPAPLMYGEPALATGPFAWLMALPGVDTLRVPARFFMITTLCLAVIAGLVLAPLLRRAGPRAGAAIIVVAAAALLADGWGTLRAGPLPPGAPAPELIRRGVAMTLPLGSADTDGPAELEAVENGWASVNGWSGYRPAHYHWLQAAQRQADFTALAPILRRGDLHVLVRPAAASMVSVVEGLPGAQRMAEANGVVQFRIPRQGTPPPAEPPGRRLAITALTSSCSPEYLDLPLDGDYRTRWHCGAQRPGQSLTIDLGSVVTVGAVVPALGVYSTDVPRHLALDVSSDGSTWETLHDGTVLPEALEAILHAPTRGRIVLTFPPRPVRYVRLSQMERDETWFWSIAEIEVWSGT